MRTIWTNPATMDLRFPGQWFQLETGLAYNWHRHYDPTIGRYLQPDPLGLKALLSDGPSVYNYVGGNPIAWVDIKGTLGGTLPHPNYTPLPVEQCGWIAKCYDAVSLACHITSLFIPGFPVPPQRPQLIKPSVEITGPQVPGKIDTPK